MIEIWAWALGWVAAAIALAFLFPLHGHCEHRETRAIPVDEQGNWMQCMRCHKRKGLKGWRSDK